MAARSLGVAGEGACFAAAVDLAYEDTRVSKEAYRLCASVHRAAARGRASAEQKLSVKRVVLGCVGVDIGAVKPLCLDTEADLLETLVAHPDSPLLINVDMGNAANNGGHIVTVAVDASSTRRNPVLRTHSNTAFNTLHTAHSVAQVLRSPYIFGGVTPNALLLPSR